MTLRQGPSLIMHAITLGILAMAFLWQTTLARRAWSITFDETFYLNTALQTDHDARLDPRLSQNGTGALPVLLANVPAAMTVERTSRPSEWRGSPDDPPVNALARLISSLLVGLPLVVIVYTWLLVRRGYLGATIGGAMMAFSPTVLAHASLASTDACFALATLVSLAALAAWYRKPTPPRFLLAGATIGLAISSKYSGVFLFPVLLFVLLPRMWERSSSTGWRRFVAVGWMTGARLVLVAALAGLVVWATDGFSFSGPLKTVPVEETPANSPWVKVLGNGPTASWIMDAAHRRLQRPSVVAAVIFRWLHNRRGHPAFLMGERSMEGWRWYFPLAWIVKSTIPEFLLSLAIVPLLVVALRSNIDEEVALGQTRFVWLVAGGVFWVMVCMARVNIGQRYLLVLYPLTFLIGIDLLCLVWRWRQRWLLVVGGLLMTAQVASAVAIAPHYLAYFSPLVGGAPQGRHYLVDSNIDWGQDLPALRSELERLGYDRPLLAYFGSADPEGYGLDVTMFPTVEEGQLDRFDVIAISASKLQGVYPDGDPFAPFRELSPTGTAGYSILLYDLADPQAAEALRIAWRRYPDDERARYTEIQDREP
ncbi:Dolichyl-phosphate-mannose-protein mannosyltransferase [Planctomycetes bacterium Pan216]|uniref:Dolichyl-phosphate-mannose-protein mannosyltransferase n=1 Tax=Kolteria novifilia TaxID=2527975 RepID=A0A518BC59_9BACT|nr:Dolichyl-phosphate-mannose-protein mannosyltransferase [Planctomycetes bacterium Pan216]